MVAMFPTSLVTPHVEWLRSIMLHRMQSCSTGFWLGLAINMAG